MAPELNVLALCKGGETYIYVFDDPGCERVIQAIRNQAADPGLTLDWHDAALLTVKAREQAGGVRAAPDPAQAPPPGCHPDRLC